MSHWTSEVSQRTSSKVQGKYKKYKGVGDKSIFLSYIKDLLLLHI